MPTVVPFCEDCGLLQGSQRLSEIPCTVRRAGSACAPAKMKCDRLCCGWAAGSSRRAGRDGPAGYRRLALRCAVAFRQSEADEFLHGGNAILAIEGRHARQPLLEDGRVGFDPVLRDGGRVIPFERQLHQLAFDRHGKLQVL